jgi:hypothetical protein
MYTQASTSKVAIMEKRRDTPGGAWLRADARGCDGGVREVLAKELKLRDERDETKFFDARNSAETELPYWLEAV